MYWSQALLLRAKVGCVLLKLLSLLCWYSLSHHHDWLVKVTVLQWLCQGCSRSWCHQVHLWGAVQVYISSRNLDGGFLLWVNWSRKAGIVSVWLWGAPVDGICVHCHLHTVGRALHGICSIVAGAAGVGVVGATVVGIFTTWVAGADVDAASATLPMLCLVWQHPDDLSNVVMSTSILSTTNDLDLVWAIIGFVDDSGREPQVPGIIEDRYSLTSKEWRFLVAALLVMILCTLGGTLIEVVMFSIGMQTSVSHSLWHSGA